MVNTSNPRYANGHRRRNLRTRILREETHCAICGHEVDKTLPTPHPYSPEIDEIIPISLGGNPLDRDGYHDHLHYQGTSTWQALKAVTVGLRNGMRITIERHIQ